MKHTSPYRTASELGIEEWERDGLIDLLRNPPPDGQFNMTCCSGTCGTVACIGGWLAIRRGRRSSDKILNYVKRHKTLEALFYPEIPFSRWPRGDWRPAALAITNFLTLGDPRWAEVVKGDRE